MNKENGKTPYEEKSGCRKCWEVYHGASGFITTLLGLGQVFLADYNLKHYQLTFLSLGNVGGTFGDWAHGGVVCVGRARLLVDLHLHTS